MKNLILLLFVVFFVHTTKSKSSEPHNVEYGQRVYDDKLIYNNVVREKYKMLQVVKKDITIASDLTISYIKITDQYTDGNGGYASVTEGGVGFKNAVLHLKSKRNHGFNFRIEVYAH